MFRLPPVLAVLLLLVPLLAGTAGGEGTTSRYIVGYEPGQEKEAHLAIKAAGGEVRRHSPELGFAVVETDKPSEFERLARLSPYVQYVERDGPVRITGTQWNGVQWNGVQWNGVQWNGVQWNSGEWNGVQWNDASLKDASEAQRLAAKWTEKLYQADSTNKMKWAGDATDPGLVWQWGSWAIDADRAWRGGSVGTRTASLCVLDSGVAWDHPDLARGYAGGHNAIDPLASAYDDGGHGTHVAGIAAASLADSYGMGGVANVKILNAKVLKGDGSGHESDLAFGLLWCAQQGADVALMALAVTDADWPTLQRALQYAADRDVLMVASAGNAGPCADCVSFPGRDPRVVAVTAIDGTYQAAAFASKGPQVALAAPGVHVVGTLPGGGFAFGSGTSQAAAFAAGVAASVRDAAPGLTAGQARDLLLGATRDLGPAGPDPTYGRGLVDAGAALAAARAPR